MKRVETIHINGIVFSITDDAYSKLKSYLDILTKKFANEQEGEEIIADIEARISELFAERNGGKSRVVTLEDVVAVIETLGAPDDIADTDVDAETGSAPPPRPPQTEKPPKRLFRDPDGRYIGGVCAGIAAWVGISPLIVRLLFFIFAISWGISIGVYFVLWIIVPQAKTTAQKLEMHGEPVTISNIEKNIRESLSDPSLKQSFHNFLDEAGEIFEKIFSIFGRFVGVLLGLFLCCWGILMAVVVIMLFNMQDIFFYRFVEWDFLSFTEMLRYFISPTSYTILVVCAVVIFSLTIFAFLFWGVKLITGFKVKSKWVHVVLFLLWIATIITGLVVGFAEVRNYVWRSEEIVETRTISAADTLYIMANPSSLQISNNPMDIYFDKDNQRFYGKPTLNIRQSEDGQVSLRLIREAFGENKLAAYRYAENISYNVEIVDSLLFFDSFFSVLPYNKWKFQRLEMTLYIPAGTVIVADKTLQHDRFLGYWLTRLIHDKLDWVIFEDMNLRPSDD